MLQKRLIFPETFTEWWNKIAEPYLKGRKQDNSSGRIRLVQNSIELYVNTFPNGINIPNNELTELAKKAASRIWQK